MKDHDEPGAGHGTNDDGLHARLRALPAEVQPARDLWPAIEARLEPRASRRGKWLWQAAAAVLLVAGSSLLTATLMNERREAGTIASTESPHVAAMPAAFGPGASLGAEYFAAREQLTAMLAERMAQLPPATRAKLEGNLDELRRAAEQINVALDEQPGDPLLEELLLVTYQQELAVLANVNQLTQALADVDSAGAEPKRMKL